MKKLSVIQLLAGACLWLTLGSCSSGSSSTSGAGSADGGGTTPIDTTITGLAIGEQIAIVTAKEGGGAASVSVKGKHFKLVPASGDYVTDEPEIYVYDESMEMLDMINEILCSIEQTKYPDMVNKGAYLAQIDIGKCQRQKDRSGDESNKSSGQDQQEFETWTVNTTRADNQSSQTVNFWIETEASAQDPFDEIRAVLTVTKAADDTNPFGEFSMNFWGLTNGAVSMTGSLATGTTDVGFIELSMIIEGSIAQMGGIQFAEKMHAILTPGDDTGVAYGYHKFPEGPGGLEEGTIDVAFDASHYLARFTKGGQQRTVCLDRSNFRENVWEYNLYGEDGARTTLNAGMSIKVGEHGYGWAGYHGIWLPGETGGVQDGMAVTDDDGAAYTVRLGQGRLIKKTRTEVPLADFTNDVFNMWNEETKSNIKVKYDGTQLLNIGTETCQENVGCTFTTIDPTPVVLMPNQWLGLWKQGLGNVNIVVDADGTLPEIVPVYVESFVMPDDAVFSGGSLPLQCIYDCPKAPLTGADLAPGASPYLEADEVAPYHQYTFDAVDFVLKKGGQSAVLGTGETWNTQGPNGWGVHSGSMIPTSVTLANPWEIWSQDTTYQWETGPNSWNKMSFLTNSAGNSVVFDKPLACLYEQEGEGTFMLEYNGPGQLHGIPFEKVERDESDFEHWVAAFTIPNGSAMTCEGKTYYSKAMSVEQFMVEVNPAACGALAIGNVGAPTLELPSADDLPEAAPTVTDPPAVVGGILQ